MKNIAVELIKYSFRYLNTEEWVLKELDFTLNYGELVLLSGMSGEGKSTLFNSINGIIPNIVGGEQQGDIIVAGESTLKKRASDISKTMGSVLQNPDSQIIHNRVEDEIAFGCENLNMMVSEITQAIDEACREMNLQKDWFTKTLSGGQKQRLMTAAILAMQQRILIFDEPLANLDLEGAHSLLRTLKKLASQGYAILMIEHRLDVVAPYADKIAWMEEGRVHIYEDMAEALKRGGNILTTSRLPDDRACQEPCFILDQLSFGVPEREILKELSMTIYKGERIVILGENGCGKTTLLRLLAKMLRPSSGAIKQYIDKGSKKPGPSWFEKLGFVYQNPSYQLFMPTVWEEVNLRSRGSEATDEALRKFRLDELKERHPQSLSEGQKRRLTVACVIAMEPEVILLDEPTVGQDYEGLKNMIEILNEVHQVTKNTLITITHDFRCAEAMADRILWMREGRFYKTGGPELAKEYFEMNLKQFDLIK